MPSTYQQTLSYLYEQLPMFTRVGSAAIKKDLTNTIKFCEALDMPHEKFKSIHIAGTNGKGSVSHMLASATQEAGYKTGLYTSPHLVDFRARIRINGTPVSEEWVVNFVRQYKDKIEEIQPSFFEITVAMAFAAFAEEEVDVAIIETGLGGRLDSTNVIKPLLSVITNIGYDHMDMLGNTLTDIAGEKAGIIKEGVPVVLGEQHPETEPIFFRHSVQKKAPIYYADAVWSMARTSSNLEYQTYKAIHGVHREMHDVTTDMLGEYQANNIKTVLTVRDVMVSNGMIDLPLDTTLRSLSKVKKTTGFRGRWDVIQTEPTIIADVAHNANGLKGVLKQWSTIEANTKHIVLGFVKDKDVDKALELFPKDATYYFCNAGVPRAMAASELKKKAEEFELNGKLYATVDEAVEAARGSLTKDDALLITGSTFIVGEAIGYLNINNGKLFPTSLEEHI